jgi:hypothetical protein
LIDERLEVMKVEFALAVDFAKMDFDSLVLGPEQGFANG